MTEITITPDQMKVVVCETMIAINDEYDPVSREKWGPIIPPTSIDWIGDKIVAALVAKENRHDE